METKTLIALVIAAAVSAVVMLLIQRRNERMPSQPPPPGMDPDAAIQHHLAQGQKIQAIKIYREHHGVGLREAKEAIERLAREQRG